MKGERGPSHCTGLRGKRSVSGEETFYGLPLVGPVAQIHVPRYA